MEQPEELSKQQDGIKRVTNAMKQLGQMAQVRAMHLVLGSWRCDRRGTLSLLNVFNVSSTVAWQILRSMSDTEGRDEESITEAQVAEVIASQPDTPRS